MSVLRVRFNNKYKYYSDAGTMVFHRTFLLAVVFALSYFSIFYFYSLFHPPTLCVNLFLVSCPFIHLFN